MNNIDILENAIYYEIICRLIYVKNVSSEIKLIFLSFSIKGLLDEPNIRIQKYNRLDLLFKGIDKNLFSHISDFCIIFDCINELKEQGYIRVNDGRISMVRTPNFSKTIKCLTQKSLDIAINELEKLSDESIIRSIIEYV